MQGLLENESRFTFADNEAGLTHALHTTLSQRRNGNKTVLVPRQWGPTRVNTVRSFSPPRPNRRERGCVFGTGR